MAVKLNIGKFGTAIEEISRTVGLISRGPERDITLDRLSYADLVSAEADVTETKNVFIFGIHKWGDKNNLVG